LPDFSRGLTTGAQIRFERVLLFFVIIIIRLRLADASGKEQIGNLVSLRAIYVAIFTYRHSTFTYQHLRVDRLAPPWGRPVSEQELWVTRPAAMAGLAWKRALSQGARIAGASLNAGVIEHRHQGATSG
jgi:hypothetical protein